MLSKTKYRYRAIFLISILLILASLVIYNSVYHKGASFPEAAWSQFVIAIQTQNLESVQTITTDRGFEILKRRVGGREDLQRWQIWGNHLAEHEEEWLHWEYVDENRARAYCCGQNESAYIFIKVSGNWQLDEILFGS